MNNIYFLKSIFSSFLNFYDNLDSLGLLLFYSFFIILFLIVLLFLVMSKSKINIESNLDITNEDIDNSLDNIGKIARKIDVGIESDNINLTSFEKIQEEESIISYEELLKKAPKGDKVENKDIKSKFVTSPVISPIYGFADDSTKRESIKAKEKPEGENEVTFNIQKEKEVDQKIIEKELFLKELKKLKSNLN